MALLRVINVGIIMAIRVIVAILDARFMAQYRKVAVIAVHIHVVKVSTASTQRGLFSAGCFLLNERNMHELRAEEHIAYKFP